MYSGNYQQFHDGTDAVDPEERYSKWIKRCEKECLLVLGVSLSDLPDVDSWELFEEGFSPAEAIVTWANDDWL